MRSTIVQVQVYTRVHMQAAWVWCNPYHVVVRQVMSLLVELYPQVLVQVRVLVPKHGVGLAEGSTLEGEGDDDEGEDADEHD